MLDWMVAKDEEEEETQSMFAFKAAWNLPRPDLHFAMVPPTEPKRLLLAA